MVLFPFFKTKKGDFLSRERKLRDAIIQMSIHEGPSWTAMRLNSYESLLTEDGPFRDTSLEMWVEGRNEV